MTLWRTACDTKYVSSADIEGEVIAQIATAMGGEGEGKDKRKFRKPRITFANAKGEPLFPDAEGRAKPFFPSNTDSTTLSSLSGSKHMESWVGLVVKLYATTTKLKGEMVPCIRVHQQLVKDNRPKRGAQAASVPGSAEQGQASATAAAKPSTPVREPGSDDR